MYSDGFPDQFGGEKGKKYKSKRFTEFLSSLQGQTMPEQHDMLEQEFEAWITNEYKQVDDALVVGVSI